MILPPATRRALDQALAHVTSHDLIFNRWGLGERHPTGLALAFNLRRTARHGKTICAEAIAHALGRRLLVVRYAEVESMWMGETPKNVAALFRLAREEKAVLLFDEADAIASRRSASPDHGLPSGGKYGRQRAAQGARRRSSGVVIFATNLAAQLRSGVRAPHPDARAVRDAGVDEREQIWRVQMHPRLTPLAADVDFRALAETYEVTGGDIRNAVLKAAMAAASEPGGDALKAIHHRHLDEGIRDVLPASA